MLNSKEQKYCEQRHNSNSEVKSAIAASIIGAGPIGAFVDLSSIAISELAKATQVMVALNFFVYLPLEIKI